MLVETDLELEIPAANSTLISECTTGILKAETASELRFSDSESGAQSEPEMFVRS